MPDFDILDWFIILLIVCFCIKFVKRVILIVPLLLASTAVCALSGTAPETLNTLLSIVLGTVIVLAVGYYYVKGFKLARRAVQRLRKG